MISKKILPLILILASTASAQDLSKIGNVVIKLLCILYGIVPWILTLLFILAGILIVTGSSEKRDQGKKVMINAIIGALILFLVTFLLTLIVEGLEFSDFTECWVWGTPPSYPTTTILPKNQPPTAVARVDSVSPPIQESVTVRPGDNVYFSGSGSYDPNGFIMSHQWSFGDGDSGTGNSVSHVYSEVGAYSAQLIVMDDDFARDNDEVDVTVVL